MHKWETCRLLKLIQAQYSCIQAYYWKHLRDLLSKSRSLKGASISNLGVHVFLWCGEKRCKTFSFYLYFCVISVATLLLILTFSKVLGCVRKRSVISWCVRTVYFLFDVLGDSRNYSEWVLRLWAAFQYFGL